MQNDLGEVVELYVPRKCSSSSRIISATDHAAVQIDFADVDPNTGRMIPGKVIRLVSSLSCKLLKDMRCFD